MMNRLQTPGAYYRHHEEIKSKVVTLHDKMFLDKVPFDVCDVVALEALVNDELVQSDWSLGSLVEDMRKTRKAGVMLTGKTDVRIGWLK